MSEYINKNNFIQYELWKDCSLGCRFCYNKGQKDIDKLKSLEFVLNNLDDKKMLDYDQIGFIGGQFFNGQLKNRSVKQNFYRLFKKTSEMHFKKIYITASLNYNISEYLTEFLDFLESLNIIDKVLLCTSYDMKYRFKTESQEQRWKNNIMILHERYKSLHIHSETIITQFFINAVLENRFSITEFSEKYDIWVDYIQPRASLCYDGKQEFQNDVPDFFPTKKSFIRFLKKCCVQNNWIDLNTFLSLQLRANTLYFIDQGEYSFQNNRRNSDGILELKDKSKKFYIGFIDSQDNMRSIVQEFKSCYE